jgi:chromosome segregation ATPase
MKTEDINNRIEWINARTPLNDLQKEYVALIVSESIKDKTKELQEQLAESNERIIELEKLHKQKVENIGILNQDRHNLIEQLSAKDKELSEVKGIAIEFYQCIEYIPSELQQGYLKLINPQVNDKK